MTLPKQLTPRVRDYALSILMVIVATIVIAAPKLLNSQKEATPQQIVAKVNPTPTSTLTPLPTDAHRPGWKKYVNTAAGYSIDIPASWTAANYEDKGTTLNFFPPGSYDKYSGDPNVASMSINAPIPYEYYYENSQGNDNKNLQAVEMVDRENAQSNARYLASVNYDYSTIHDHEVLTAKRVNKSSADVTYPQGFAGEPLWDQYSTKKVYIDMQNGQVLEIDGSWGKNQSDFELTFDRSINTFQFISSAPNLLQNQ